LPGFFILKLRRLNLSLNNNFQVVAATQGALPSSQVQVHTEHIGKAKGEEPDEQQRDQEDGDHHGALAQQYAPVSALLALVVVPLDGEEHARAKHEDFERNEDYGDPIDHFENSSL
jgi:hypothetical protein